MPPELEVWEGRPGTWSKAGFWPTDHNTEGEKMLATSETHKGPISGTHKKFLQIGKKRATPTEKRAEDTNMQFIDELTLKANKHMTKYSKSLLITREI